MTRKEIIKKAMDSNFYSNDEILNNLRTNAKPCKKPIRIIEGVDVTLDIKRKFISRPSFILNAVATIVIISILLNVTLFRGIFNKNPNVTDINFSPSNSILPKETPNYNETPVFKPTTNNIGKIIVGDSNTILYTIIKSRDGGFVTAGRQVKDKYSDAIIKKIDNTGSVEWTKSYGGNGLNEFRSIIQTDDGGYIAVGESEDINTHSSLNAIIYKTDGVGNIEWSKTLDEIDINNINIDVERLTLNKVIQTADKGFVIVGHCNNFNGAIMIKLNSSGSKIWEVIYNISYGAMLSSVLQLADGGLLAIGDSSSTDGDFIGKEGIDIIGVVVKFDCNGKKLWSQYSSYDFQFGSIVQISNGEILVSGNNVFKEHENIYGTLTKYSNDGNTIWEKNYKDNLGSIGAPDIFKTDENSIIGISYPFICKFDNNGNIIWKNKYCDYDIGSSNYIWVKSLVQSSEDSYICCGKGYGDGRACVFFFDKNGNIK